MKKKSNQANADTAARTPAVRLPSTATATTATTRSRATFVFDQLARQGSRMAATASGTSTPAISAMWSRDRC